LPCQGELPFARVELRLEAAELARSSRARILVGSRLSRRAARLECAGPRDYLTRTGFEPVAFLLELDPTGGELLLDAPCALGPLLELRALCTRELALRQRLVQLRLRVGALRGELGLADCNPLRLSLERRRACL
jgi:hypothetical protein